MAFDMVLHLSGESRAYVYKPRILNYLCGVSQTNPTEQVAIDSAVSLTSILHEHGFHH